MISIDIEAPTILFNDHFSKHDNKHIVFSAPFGFGKTYFLRKFFENIKTLYNAFWLSPVGYVVGQNEDIFEYIKTDIAIQLLKSDIVKLKTSNTYSEDLFVNEYFSERPRDIAKLLFESIKDLDIPLVKQGAQLLLNGLKAKDEYDSWKRQQVESTKGEFDKLFDYVSENTNIKGSIFEEDIITKLIRLVLLAIKSYEQDNKKENILIIDDFDRLDPEHIFRILNILSVHQQFSDNEDKFGFDKIIIVCHISNIKNIFIHKFGEKVDFNGYMEKFYSSEIFHFNNQSTISTYCKNSFGGELSDPLIRVLGIYLSFFIRRNIINVRSIIKYERTSFISPFELGVFSFPEEIDNIDDDVKVLLNSNGYPNGTSKTVWGDDFKDPIEKGTSQFTILSSDFPFLKIVQILVTIFGDLNHLMDHLNKELNSTIVYPEELNQVVINSLIPFVHFIKSCESSEKIFSNIYNKNHTVMGQSYIAPAMTYELPISSILNNKITINVGWNKNNQYKAGMSYYSLVKNNNCIIESYSVSYNYMKDQLINFLKIIVDYLNNQDYFKLIGISQ